VWDLFRELNGYGVSRERVRGGWNLLVDWARLVRDLLKSMECFTDDFITLLTMEIKLMWRKEER